MSWRCEICDQPEPDREKIFGCSCAGCEEVHWVHQACAERIGIWGVPFGCWGVKTCPDAAKVANMLMGKGE